MKTAKFGGTSLMEAQRVRHAAQIILNRRFVVAP